MTTASFECMSVSHSNAGLLMQCSGIMSGAEGAEKHVTIGN